MNSTSTYYHVWTNQPFQKNLLTLFINMIFHELCCLNDLILEYVLPHIVGTLFCILHQTIYVLDLFPNAYVSLCCLQVALLHDHKFDKVGIMLLLE